MAREASLPASFIAWLTGAVQCGFVLGTLVATLALPDRVDPRRLIAAASLVGAVANGLVLLLPVGSPWVVLARGATGMALACVYPVGMKLAASWAGRADAGLVVGLLVGGLTLAGVTAFGQCPRWCGLAHHHRDGLSGSCRRGHADSGDSVRPSACFRTALSAWAGAAAVPHPRHSLGHARLSRPHVGNLRHVGLDRHLSGGELRGRRTGCGSRLGRIRGVHGHGCRRDRLCAAGGMVADRIGTVRLTIWAMAVSGVCCLLAGPAFGMHPFVVVALCLWLGGGRGSLTPHSFLAFRSIRHLGSPARC